MPSTGDYTVHTVVLQRDSAGGFGFSVTGEDPVSVRNIRSGGPSDGPQGLKTGDLILKVCAAIDSLVT